MLRRERYGIIKCSIKATKDRKNVENKNKNKGKGHKIENNNNMVDSSPTL